MVSSVDINFNFFFYNVWALYFIENYLEMIWIFWKHGWWRVQSKSYWSHWTFVKVKGMYKMKKGLGCCTRGRKISIDHDQESKFILLNLCIYIYYFYNCYCFLLNNNYCYCHCCWCWSIYFLKETLIFGYKVFVWKTRTHS